MKYFYLFLIIIAICIFACLCCRWHNFRMRKKYRRKRIEQEKDFEIMRCLEEKSRIKIYIVDKKRKTYHHIKNVYTLEELGFGLEDVGKTNSECFSKANYWPGKKIKIYKIIFGTFFNKFIKIE